MTRREGTSACKKGETHTKDNKQSCSLRHWVMEKKTKSECHAMSESSPGVFENPTAVVVYIALCQKKKRIIKSMCGI
jgi:hypothetical protein